METQQQKCFTVVFPPVTNSKIKKKKNFKKNAFAILLTLLLQIIVRILCENIRLSSIPSTPCYSSSHVSVLRISSGFVSFQLPRCQFFFTCRERNENRISSDSRKIRSEILSALCFHVERLSPLACLAVISKFITGAGKERN